MKKLGPVTAVVVVVLLAGAFLWRSRDPEPPPRSSTPAVKALPTVAALGDAELDKVVSRLQAKTGFVVKRFLAPGMSVEAALARVDEAMAEKPRFVLLAFTGGEPEALALLTKKLHEARVNAVVLDAGMEPSWKERSPDAFKYAADVPSPGLAGADDAQVESVVTKLEALFSIL